MQLCFYFAITNVYDKKPFPTSIGIRGAFGCFPSHQFLQITAAANVDVVKEDLRDCAAARQLLQLGSKLWMLPHIHITDWYFQMPEDGLSLRTLWAALDRVHCYPALSTALKLSHLQE